MIPTTSIRVGDYEANVLNVPLKISKDQLYSLHESLQKYCDVYKKESTWVHEMFGAPTLFGRDDIIPTKGGDLKICEREDRPAGRAVAGRIVPGFTERNTRIETSLGADIAWVDGDVPTDDRALYGDPIDMTAARDQDLVLYRIPWQDDYAPWRKNSVSTFESHACKAYGLSLGWWHMARADDDLAKQLPTDLFVVKPLVGRLARDMTFTVPDRHRGGGDEGICVTRDEAIRMIKERGAAYIQDFHVPMKAENFQELRPYEFLADKTMLFRLWWAIDPTKSAPGDLSFLWLGGHWSAANSLANNSEAEGAVIGPLELPCHTFE